MVNAKIQELYTRFDNWLNAHSHRDRLFIAMVGFVVIYFFWYLFFEKPVLEKIQAHHQALLAQKNELDVFNHQIVEMQANAKIMLAKRKEEKNVVVAKIPLATPKDNDIIIQTILTPQTNVQFVRLNNVTPAPGVVKPPMKNDLELAFNSNYFSTIDYLSQLEKLPWCLSWDSLEYKVAQYPEALVVINLHIVNS